MPLQPVLIGGQWQPSQNPTGSFSAVNPATKTPLIGQYPISNQAEVELALQAGQHAAAALRAVSAETIAHFLERCADHIEAIAEQLVELANLETALPAEPRLRSVELPRTTNQLRQAAKAARDGWWQQATIDTQSNIRSKYGPLGGPVAVFGPNNFPFAFNSVAGGDFAAAIAAGNPVIAKANPGHPGTTKLLAEAVFAALGASGLPPETVQLIYHTPSEVGLKLVADPRVGATAFTGSRTAGLKLKEAADKAGKPIYLEMSSVNPVYILPGALRERPQPIADDLYRSCLLGAGQFCTKPGLVVIQKNEQSQPFIEQVQHAFEQNPPGTLLNDSGLTLIAEAIAILRQNGAELLTGGQEVANHRFAFTNTLLQVSGDQFLRNPDGLQTEAFGTVCLVVVAQDQAQMNDIATHMAGSLTGCIYSSTQGEDEAAYEQIEPILRQKVGRLLNDKMPTGVAVVPSMNHGGPFPATGHPGFTAVGLPASLHRFAALHCYDNVRPHRLPPELQDKNPTGRLWRLIDGHWTQADV
jgi:alpha-ketoglutaric semialdehyde dehydrogenase